mmetsp:Transcript_108978/g.170339  ORF Transcript_108978/g.170339 Transcript_108978/m.170339 type:complete len:591 (+) Transcript_108978:59-1831(+)
MKMLRRSGSNSSGFATKDEFDRFIRAALQDAVGNISDTIRNEVRDNFSKVRDNISSDMRQQLSEALLSIEKTQKFDGRASRKVSLHSSTGIGIVGGSLQNGASGRESSDDSPKRRPSFLDILGSREPTATIREDGYVALTIDRNELPTEESASKQISGSGIGSISGIAGAKTRPNMKRHIAHDELESIEDTRLSRFVTSSKFEWTAGLLVLTNVLCLGIETNLHCRYIGKIPDYWASIIEAEEFIFCLLFLTELVCRVLVYGRSFCIMEGWYWNVFDTFIVALQVVDQLVTLLQLQLSGFDLDMISSVRIMRLVRILRIVRVFHLFDELGTLVISIGKSTSALCWALVLLCMMIYTFSVLFAQLALLASDGDMSDELQYWFGDVSRTGLTLFESILGGASWDTPITLLINEVSMFSAFMFCFYVAVGLFVMLNVVTGVFIDKAIRAAQEEGDIRLAEAISSTFTGEGGCAEDISWSQFKEKLDAPGLSEYFHSINVDTSEAHGLFDLLDVDGSGTVDSHEIVQGCLRLKGTARALDVALLMQLQLRMNEKIEEHITRVDRHLNSMAHQMGLKRLTTRTEFESERPETASQ